ncbi:MAG: phosphoribosyltransferase family protein [Gammaproteobacteria bacterium]|nr:phosphoribosyltransferase family protein [Gammaproteobacteria bacterium]MCY4277627.1 phosphoribosyltransferase family protein [Gammaproteobacteria bacterium]
MTDSAQSGAVVFTEQQVTKAIDQLAARLTARLAGSEPTLVCMMNGGFVLSAAIMQRLALPMRLDYVHVSRYRDGARGGDIEWRVRPGASINGRTVLLVDDICDEGLSLAAAKNALHSAGAREVVTAVLVQRCGVPRSAAADFAALECGPGFLVGWGMDHDGLGRNSMHIKMLESDE